MFCSLYIQAYIIVTIISNFSAIFTFPGQRLCLPRSGSSNLEWVFTRLLCQADINWPNHNARVGSHQVAVSRLCLLPPISDLQWAASLSSVLDKAAPSLIVTVEWVAVCPCLHRSLLPKWEPMGLSYSFPLSSNSDSQLRPHLVTMVTSIYILNLSLAYVSAEDIH